MVFTPLETTSDCCPSCGRQNNQSIKLCGVCERLTKTTCSKTAYRCHDVLNEAKVLKVRRVENLEFSSSSDEDFVESGDLNSASDSDNESSYSKSRNESDSYSCLTSSCETPPDCKSGLFLLLEAAITINPESVLEKITEVERPRSPPRTPVENFMVDNCDIKKSCPSMSDPERWTMMLEALLEYGRTNLHYNCPNSYECSIRGHEVKLGTWLSTQRQLKRKGNLRPEREVLLQELVDKGLLCWSMPSVASPDDDKWTTMYNALIRYGKGHNNCNVPYSYDAHLEDGSVVKLGAWLRKQREQKKKGSLRPDRDQRLQVLVEMNILRMPSGQYSDDDHWNAMMEALEEYGAKYGHCNVPQSHEFRTSDGTIVRLGSWLRKQRELRKKGMMRADRELSLQSLVDQNVLMWDAPCHSASDDDKWDVMLGALIGCANEYGHCNLSSFHTYTTYDGTTVKLGAWLSQQRHYFKKGKLRADREQKLQVLVDEGKLSWGMRCEGLKLAERASSPLSSC